MFAFPTSKTKIHQSRMNQRSPLYMCVCEIIEDRDLYVCEAGRGIDSG